MLELAEEVSAAYGQAADIAFDEGDARAEPAVTRALGLRLDFHAHARAHGLSPAEPMWGVYSRAAVTWHEPDVSLERSVSNLTDLLGESYWFLDGDAWRSRIGRPRRPSADIVYLAIMMTAEEVSARSIVRRYPQLEIHRAVLTRRICDEWSTLILAALFTRAPGSQASPPTQERRSGRSSPATQRRGGGR